MLEIIFRKKIRTFPVVSEGKTSYRKECAWIHTDLSFEKAAPGERRALVFCSLLEPLDLEHTSSSGHL